MSSQQKCILRAAARSPLVQRRRGWKTKGGREVTVLVLVYVSASVNLHTYAGLLLNLLSEVMWKKNKKNELNLDETPTAHLALLGPV